jgi:hypothetical protein
MTRDSSLVALGLLFVAAGLPLEAVALGAPSVLGSLLQLLSFGASPGELTAAARLGCALAGALTAGWGLMVLFLGQGWPVRRALVASTIAWFVLDSGASVALGFGGNAISNVGFLVAVLVGTRMGRMDARTA